MFRTTVEFQIIRYGQFLPGGPSPIAGGLAVGPTQPTRRKGQMRILAEKRENKFLFTFGSDGDQVPAHGFAEAFGFIPSSFVTKDFVVMSLEGDAGRRLRLRLLRRN